MMDLPSLFICLSYLLFIFLLILQIPIIIMARSQKVHAGLPHREQGPSQSLPPWNTLAEAGIGSRADSDQGALK